MNKIRLLLLVFLIMSLSGCTPRGCSFLPRASLLILSHHLEKIEETVTVDEEVDVVLSVQITGVARNNSATELQYAEVIGKFYDKQGGTLLHKGVAKTTNLGPGQIWEFTVPYPWMTAHPSLTILSCKVEKDGSTAKAFGSVRNDGDVMVSARITVTFHDVAGEELGTGTTGIVDLEVGETREYAVFYPGSDYEQVDYVTAKVGDLTQEVNYATVQVGTLRGRSVMP